MADLPIIQPAPTGLVAAGAMSADAEGAKGSVGVTVFWLIAVEQVISKHKRIRYKNFIGYIAVE